MSESKITLGNGKRLHVVDNEHGTVVTLLGRDDKAIASMAFSAHANKMIGMFDYSKQERLYQCTECKATYDYAEAGSYCQECGHDEGFLIEEDEI